MSILLTSPRLLTVLHSDHKEVPSLLCQIKTDVKGEGGNNGKCLPTYHISLKVVVFIGIEER